MSNAFSRARLGHERYLGYIACTRARERLVLTCAEFDSQGKKLNRSFFFDHVQRLFPSSARPRTLPGLHRLHARARTARTHVCRVRFAGKKVESLVFLRSCPTPFPELGSATNATWVTSPARARANGSYSRVPSSIRREKS